MNGKTHQRREHWASRLGFVMAAAGSAVGLGNVWRFPYVAGENGGAAFLIIYLAIVFTLGISIMIAELAIGRAAQTNPVGATRLLGGRAWAGLGYLGILAAFLILSFYTVIAGWTLSYAMKMASGALSRSGVDTAQAFAGFVADPAQTIPAAAVFMVLTIAVVLGGVKGGIERASMVLMPLLFLILVALAIRAVTLPGAGAGLRFFLTPDFSKVGVATLTTALGQAFFSLSIGLGAMMTYGSYLDRDQNIGHAAGWVVGLDTLAAMLAGFAILPAVFAAGLNPECRAGARLRDPADGVRVDPAGRPVRHLVFRSARNRRADIVDFAARTHRRLLDRRTRDAAGAHDDRRRSGGVSPVDPLGAVAWAVGGLYRLRQGHSRSSRCPDRGNHASGGRPLGRDLCRLGHRTAYDGRN